MTLTKRKRFADDNSETLLQGKQEVHMDQEPITSIRAILADSYTNPIPMESVAIGRVANRSSIFPVMRELGTKLPLVDRLQHLKRVRCLNVVLVPLSTIVQDSDFWSGHTDLDQSESISVLEDATKLSKTLEKYLRFKDVSEETIAMFTQSDVGLTRHDVPQSQPMLRWQYDIANEHWPCKFHPNKNIENQFNHTVFSAEEMTFHIQIFRVLNYIDTMSVGDCGIAVDPLSKRVVALGIGNVTHHPTMHSPMVLIDAVARSQSGGAWNSATRVLPMNEGELPTTVPETNPELCLDGIDDPWRRSISSHFPQIQFGAPRVLQKPIDSIERTGPYLSTGYDIYLTQEPCLMCAMALTHSRVRTVFFAEAHAKGALKSLTKLHTLKALNHHVDVYQFTRILHKSCEDV